MAVFDFFKKNDKNGKNADEVLIEEIINESVSKCERYSFPSLGKIESYKKIQDMDDDRIKNFAKAVISYFIKFKSKKNDASADFMHGYLTKKLLGNIFSNVLRKKICFSDRELLELSGLLNDRNLHDDYFNPFSYMSLISKIEENVKEHGLNDVNRKALDLLIIKKDYENSEIRKNNDRIKYILRGCPDIILDTDDNLGSVVTKFLNDPNEKKVLWKKYINHVITASDKSVPSNKWLSETENILKEIGYEEFSVKCIEWLENCQEMLKQIHKGKASFSYLKEINHNFLKGLIWSCSVINNSELNSVLDEYCYMAYKKLPGVGPVSEKTGNACLFCFYMLPFKEGISRLTKFRVKIRYPSIIKIIDKYIRLTAEKANCSREVIEEISIPDFSLDENGLLKTLIGEYAGIYKIDNIGKSTIYWEKDGKRQTSVPSNIKTGFPDELKNFKNKIKEIEKFLPVQKVRIEQFFLNSREWKFGDWKQNYIDHPLVSIVAKRLVWEFDNGARKESGVFFENGFTGNNGDKITFIDENTIVRIWHPLFSDPEDVVKWRNFLQNKEIMQPFKQVYREIYIVTDAELETDTYSNRFAAHILRQHQFTALCKERGWNYSLQGQWDSHNTPFIILPLWNIKAEFFVDACYNSTATAAGIYNYVSTDQVKFYKDDQPMNIIDVPKIVFSELMRDVDMFVGVTSIGNDPAWNDTGDRNFYGYWTNYSFGELSESSKTRALILKNLIPKLKIAASCSFDNKFLIVNGSKRIYKIHMGSGNILMSPNDQYLCIVPSSSSEKLPDRIFLPFEGDNLLSVIISKALMLAEDEKISDKTILSQINK